MSQIPRLLRALSEPLIIEPQMGRAFAQLFARKSAGEMFDGARIHAELGLPDNSERRSKADPPLIAVIPVYGVIAQHPQSLGASTVEIGAMFDRAMAREDVKGVIFDVDSPGGTVPGTPELAAKILAARGQKPMLAIANSLMASAAYWIASQADEIWVAPSGEAGSIGVYTVHEDYSKALAEAGVVVTSISYGEHKLEGSPYEPLGEEAKARLQARVDEVGGWFDKAVAVGRKVSVADVRKNFGQGLVFGAKQAVEAGLADKVGTFDEAVTRLAKMIRKTPKGSRAAVEREKLRLDSAA